MASNLETTLEIAKIIEQQNKLYAQQSSMLKGQLAIMEQLARTMKEINPADNKQDIEEFNDALEKMSENVEELGSSSTIGMESFNKLAESMMGQTNKLGGSMKKFGKAGMLLAPVVGVVNMVGGGFKLLFNTFKAGFGIAKATIGAVANLGMSIIAFPFQMLKGLIEMSDQGGDSGLREALEAIRKDFGDLSKNASHAITTISRGMRGQLAETGLRSRRIFGNLAETMQYVAEVATNMGATFDLVRQSFVDNGERVGAYIKGLGLTAEGQQALAYSSIVSGQSLQELGRQMTTYAYGVGEAFGFNGKTISRDVGKMMSDVKNFGNMAPKVLANVSVFARKLGVDFEKLLGVVDKFDNFEGAAEGAAHLSQAFGLQLDTLSLITEQDPAARIEQLRKAFFSAGKSVENMTRQERALLAQQTGLDDSTLSLVFAQKNASVSYAEIQKQSDKTKSKQLSQAEAMEKLANSIERMVKTMSSGTGGFVDRFLQGMSKGIRRTADFRKIMMNLRQSLRIVHLAGIKVGHAFVESFPGVKKFFGILQDLFDPKKMAGRMVKVNDAFKKFFSSVATEPKKAVGDLFKSLQSAFFENFDFKAALVPVLASFKSFWKAVFDTGMSAAEIGVEAVIQKLNEKFKDENGIGFGDKLKENFEKTMVFLQENGPKIIDIFMRVGEITKAAAPVVISFMDKILGLIDSMGGIEPIGKVLGGLWLASFPIKGIAGIAGMIGTFKELGGFMGDGKGAKGGSGLISILGKLKGVFGKVFGFLGMGLKALTGLFMTNPIGLIVGGIAIAAGLIIMNWDKVKEWFFKFTAWLGETWIKVKEGIINGVNAAINFVKNKFPEVYKTITGALASIKDKLISFSENAQKIFGKVRDIVGGMFEGIKSVITGVFDGLKTVLNTYYGFIKNMMLKAADLIAPFSSSMADKLRAGAKGIESFSNAVSSSLDGVGNKIAGAVGSVGDGIDGRIASAQRSTDAMAKGMTSAVVASQKAMTEGLKSNVENTRKSTEQQVRDAAAANQRIAKIGKESVETPTLDSAGGGPGMSDVGSAIGSFTSGDVYTKNQANAIRKSLANIQYMISGEATKGQISYVAFMADMQDRGLAKLTTGATAMVEGIKSAHTAIKDLKGVDINTDLKVLNDKLGLGSSKKLQLDQGKLQLNVTVNVKLDVDELEEVLTTRSGGARFQITSNNPYRPSS